jgi:hypothetical protein
MSGEQQDLLLYVAVPVAATILVVGLMIILAINKKK